MIVGRKKKDMSNLEVKLDEKETLTICLNVNRAKKSLLIFLIFLCFFSLIFPFSILLIIKVKLSFIITIILFGGSFIFFFRYLLWNYKGKEVYNLKSASRFF